MGGSVNPSGSNWYDLASIIDISATADQDYKFVNWSSTGYIYFMTGSTNSNTSVYINGGGTVTANFQLFDITPPTVMGISPANGSKVITNQTTIGASYSDRIAIDVASVVLKVDGNDVTSAVSVTSTGVSYPVTLANGTHDVELTVKDMSGNPTVAAWSFTVNVLPLSGGLPIEIIGGIAVAGAIGIAILVFFVRRKAL